MRPDSRAPAFECQGLSKIHNIMKFVSYCIKLEIIQGQSKLGYELKFLRCKASTILIYTYLSGHIFFPSSINQPIIQSRKHLFIKTE